ncbi:MAG: hypothetical protein U9R38_02685 [Candidatus Margulisiibacteriota bacterium]|nr:hypothetical protein [Candidatus Margulisiibacteriota bacterium]
MKGSITRYFYHRILKRGSAIPNPIPAPRRPLHHINPAALPRLTPIGRPEIRQVDPKNMMAAPNLEAAPPAIATETQNAAQVKPTALQQVGQRLSAFIKTRTAKAIAVAATFGSIALTSTLAMAAPAGEFISQAPLLGGLMEFIQNNIINLTGKGFLAVSLTLTAIAALRLSLKGRPGDPTPKRILKKYVAPVIGAGMMVGAAIFSAGLFVPFAATSLQITASTIYAGLLGIGVLYAATKASIEIGKALYNNSRVVKLDLQKMSSRNKAITILLAYASQFFNATYMAYRAVTVFSITAGVGLRMAFNLMTPGAFVGDMLLGAGLGLAYYFGLHRSIAKLVNPTQISTKPKKGLAAATKLAVAGALATTMVSAAGPTYALNLLAAFTFFMAEAFGFQHAWRWDTSARLVENTPQRIYTDQDVMAAAMAPESQHVTIFKTGFPGNFPEIVPALFLNIHTRQGTNTTMAHTNGMSPQLHEGGFNIMYAGLNKLMEMNTRYRGWIKETYQQIEQCDREGNTVGALEALAAFYERFARNVMEPCADNNGTPMYQGNFGAMGFKGFADRPRFFGNEANIGKDKPNIEHNRALGRRMEFLGGTENLERAEQLRRIADAYRVGGENMPGSSMLKPSHEEVIIILKRATDQLYRKHNIPIMMIPPFQFENVLLRKSIAKIATTNLYQEGLRNIGTGIPLVMHDPKNQRFYQKLIPTKVSRMLKTEHDEHIWRESADEANYREARNVDSRPGEDNRYKWVDRPIHTIGDNQTDILYIDNSVHFAQHKHDLRKYPTQFDQTIPQLEANEFFDVVYRNGSRLRLYGDGTGQYINNRNEFTSRRMGRKEYMKNGILWLAGTAEPADELLVCEPLSNYKGTKIGKNGQHDYRWVKLPELNPKYFFFDRGPFQSLSDAEQVDLIVTDFLANYEADMKTPYIFMQWRVKEKRKLPADRKMLDSPNDKIMMVSPTIAFFTLKVTEAGTGRKIHVPYNMQKELFPRLKDVYATDNLRRVNENVFVPEWKMIDTKAGVRLVTPQTDTDCPYDRALRVKIKYTSVVSKKGKTTREKKEYYRYLWYPLHLNAPEHYEGTRAEINIHPEKVGPNPFVKYTIARRNNNGDIITRDGTVVDRSLWDTIVAFKPLSPKEYEESSQEIKDSAPKVDDRGMVTLPAGVTYNGKNEISYFEYISLRDHLIEQTLYERFIPVGEYMTHYEPAEVE